MFGNKELEAGMLAINIRLDSIQKDLQEIKLQLAEKPIQSDSPFLTKEGLFNYKNRKPIPKEDL